MLSCRKLRAEGVVEGGVLVGLKAAKVQRAGGLAARDKHEGGSCSAGRAAERQRTGFCRRQGDLDLQLVCEARRFGNKGWGLLPTARLAKLQKGLVKLQPRCNTRRPGRNTCRRARSARRPLRQRWQRWAI